MGLKKMNDLGRVVIINSLRFPISVIRTFGEEWYRIAGTPVPVVSLRGSLCGRLVMKGRELCFEELEAICLLQENIREILAGVSTLVDDGANELLIFFYPRDWRCGEIIWTPDRERVKHVADKYRSAARVVSGDVQALERELLSREICMIFRLLDLPHDRAWHISTRNAAAFSPAAAWTSAMGPPASRIT